MIVSLSLLYPNHQTSSFGCEQIKELKNQLEFSEAKCTDLMVCKADLEELNSKWNQKNFDLTHEIEQMKVIGLCYFVMHYFSVWRYKQLSPFSPCLKLSMF